MAAVTAAVAAGAAASVGGSLISANATNKASKRAANAAAFNPYNVNLGSGGVEFNGGEVAFNPGDHLWDLRNNVFQPYSTAGFSGVDPNLIASLGLMGGNISAAALPGVARGGLETDQAITQAGALDAQGFNQYASRVNDLYGQGGVTTAAGQAGLLSALGPGRGDPAAQAALSQGVNLMGQDYGGVYDQTLGLLRQSARPDEDRAVNSKFQSLFNRGQLGTTGGANQVEALARAQEQADIQRQVQSRGLAQSIFDSNQGAARGLLGAGFSGLFGGQNANAGTAAAFGGLGLQGLRTQGDIAASLMSGYSGYGDRMISRGGQRMLNASQLFGFGQNLTDRSFNFGTQNLGLLQNLDQEERATIALGGHIGGQQAGAGANVGNFIMQGAGSGIGAGLSGLGNGLLSAGLSGTFSQPQPAGIGLVDPSVTKLPPGADGPQF